MDEQISSTTTTTAETTTVGEKVYQRILQPVMPRVRLVNVRGKRDKKWLQRELEKLVVPIKIRGVKKVNMEQWAIVTFEVGVFIRFFFFVKFLNHTYICVEFR